MVPSVTSVLSCIPKPGLEAWKEKVGAAQAGKVVKQASEYGSRVHDALEHYIKEGEVPKEEEIAEIVGNFARWADRNVDSFVAVEEALFNSELYYAGTCDAAVRMRDGSLRILDFKTSKAVHREHHIQVAAYRRCTHALGEGFDPRDSSGGILMHLDKRSLGWTEIEADPDGDGRLFEIFEHALALWKWSHEFRVPEA